MPFEGHLDQNDGWSVSGWAFDRDRPNEPVEVEVELSSGFTGRVRADEFRADLLAHGVGNGRHGFVYRLPLEWKSPAIETITARIKGTSFTLNGSPMSRQSRALVELVAGDIVNNCNLRCPFCIVDYANVKGLKLMTLETFKRSLDLLPITKPGNFWLSCLHEPTLNPQFIDFIEAVPDAYRDRISFTTNLAKRLSDELLERLANSGIHSIRVSFDSRDPAAFARLRQNGKYEIFADNLARLSARLKTSRRRPVLHFITMAFKDNYREIADLVRHGRELGSTIHEIRYIYYVPHVAHWGKEHILNAAEWAELERMLAPVAATGHLSVAGPVNGTREQVEEERGLADYVARETSFGGSQDPAHMVVPDPAVIGRMLPDEALRLRMRWDGVMMTEQISEDLFRVNINKLEYSAAYFASLRVAAMGKALEAVEG